MHANSRTVHVDKVRSLTHRTDTLLECAKQWEQTHPSFRSAESTTTFHVRTDADTTHALFRCHQQMTDAALKMRGVRMRTGSNVAGTVSAVGKGGVHVVADSKTHVVPLTRARADQLWTAVTTRK